MSDGGKRLYQCPGCWSYLFMAPLDGGYECECGEGMTLIDLRNGRLTEALLAAAKWKQAFEERLVMDVLDEPSVAADAARDPKGTFAHDAQSLRESLLALVVRILQKIRLVP